MVLKFNQFINENKNSKKFIFTIYFNSINLSDSLKKKLSKLWLYSPKDFEVENQEVDFDNQWFEMGDEKTFKYSLEGVKLNDMANEDFKDFLKNLIVNLYGNSYANKILKYDLQII